MKKIILLLLVVMFAFAGCTRMVIVDENEKVAEDEWGLSLTAENVTDSGMTIVFSQMNGKQTGELETGDWYALYKEENGEWVEVPYKLLTVDIAWNSVAYIIPKGDSVSFDVEWEWLYGKLSAGKYRIDKEVMDFRGTGDFDKKIYSLEFEIK